MTKDRKRIIASLQENKFIFYYSFFKKICARGEERMDERVWSKREQYFKWVVEVTSRKNVLFKIIPYLNLFLGVSLVW